MARWHLLTNLGWYLLATHRGVVKDKADGASNCLSRISPLSRLQLVCVRTVCVNHMCNAQKCLVYFIGLFFAVSICFLPVLCVEIKKKTDSKNRLEAATCHGAHTGLQL